MVDKIVRFRYVGSATFVGQIELESKPRIMSITVYFCLRKLSIEFNKRLRYMDYHVTRQYSASIDTTVLEKGRASQKRI